MFSALATVVYGLPTFAASAAAMSLEMTLADEAFAAVRRELVRDNTFFESAATGANAQEADGLDGRLWRAIGELRPSSAQILILRYVHDHSLAEIAKIMGSTRGTVAISLFRSRARLKKIIRARSGGQS